MQSRKEHESTSQVDHMIVSSADQQALPQGVVMLSDEELESVVGARGRCWHDHRRHYIHRHRHHHHRW
ncbi:MAG: hypothetical protein J2P37_23460 [Ktedonobacteraceae bacterium]|jgi:hypothetical protein|nr:hypothetical protein [Ktedonobacteraceae bacterium]MBO0791406.1 hypothetical protein [Ktedonobacteraceae bacterium]